MYILLQTAGINLTSLFIGFLLGALGTLFAALINYYLPEFLKPKPYIMITCSKMEERIYGPNVIRFYIRNRGREKSEYLNLGITFVGCSERTPLIKNEVMGRPSKKLKVESNENYIEYQIEDIKPNGYITIQMTLKSTPKKIIVDPLSDSKVGRWRSYGRFRTMAHDSIPLKINPMD